MKILGVIPTRYNSSRFPGKPLADILGKPMIAWVYETMKRVENIDEIYVAIDDERVARVCERFKIPYIMTSKDNKTHIDRVYEVSNKIKADYYVVLFGDEPLIESEIISQVIPEAPCKNRPKFKFLKENLIVQAR